MWSFLLPAGSPLLFGSHASCFGGSHLSLPCHSPPVTHLSPGHSSAWPDLCATGPCARGSLSQVASLSTLTFPSGDWPAGLASLLKQSCPGSPRCTGLPPTPSAPCLSLTIFPSQWWYVLPTAISALNQRLHEGRDGLPVTLCVCRLL